jgi:hypothetical protein
MNTSYFAIASKDPNAVSISLVSPKFAKGIREYKKLAPTSELLFKIKNKYITHEEYEEIYNEEVLGLLDPVEVYAELGPDAIICCWEKSSFCHRHIVARWLEHNLGIEITEK